MIIPQLVSIDRYHEQLILALNNAKGRILLETMSFDGNGQMAEVVSAVLMAVDRQVAVTLVYDRYSFLDALTVGGLPAVNRLKHTLRNLSRSGVAIQKVGAIRLNPFSGRHHAKAVIVDDLIFMAGGVNLMGNSFGTNDYMWRFDNSKLADELYKLLPEVSQSRVSMSLPISRGTTLLIDGGAKNQSIIYDQLCTMVSGAEKVYYVSKLMPDSRLYDILSTKDTQYWYNTIDSAPLFDKPALLIDHMKYKLSNNYNRPSMLHAKFCIAIMSDGSMQAISGSHNFNYRGVAFGTQELAIHTADQQICRDLIEFADNL